MLKFLAQYIPSGIPGTLHSIVTRASQSDGSDPVAWLEPASTNAFVAWNGAPFRSSDVAFSIMNSFNSGSRHHIDTAAANQELSA